MSIKSTLLMIIAICVIVAFAQAQQPAASPKTIAGPAAPWNCYATFNTALPNFCVTVNGNVGNFYYPAGYSQIYTDGYGICDSGYSYYDIGTNNSGNWQASTIIEPGGPNTLPLTIKRTTSDGVWTLTQIFTR